MTSKTYTKEQQTEALNAAIAHFNGIAEDNYKTREWMGGAIAADYATALEAVKTVLLGLNGNNQPVEVDHLAEAEGYLRRLSAMNPTNPQEELMRAQTHALIASADARRRIADVLERITGQSTVEPGTSFVRTLALE